MKKVWIVFLIILAIIGAIALASIGPYRQQQARKEAERFAEQADISIEFPGTIHTSTTEELMTTIWNLAVWEQEIKDKLNHTYGHSDEELKKNSLQPVSGYARKEDLLAYALEEQWRRERDSLSESVRETIEKLFGERNSLFGFSKDTVLESYRREVFPFIIKTMEAVTPVTAAGPISASRTWAGQIFRSDPHMTVADMRMVLWLPSVETVSLPLLLNP